MERGIAILGPTASGKSAVAMALAAELGGEIVSCDSVQVYRGFDIGGAKPSRDDRARVPHHLIDIVEPHEDFDAQRYRLCAGKAIDAVVGRGRLPIVCGGTGLYLRALRFGLVELPDVDHQLRAELNAEEQAKPGSLYERLRVLDAITAAKTEPNNLVHLTRALEICLLTGEPASAVRARHGFVREEVPLRVFVLSWAPEATRRRIAERAQAMLDAGLLDEVRGLITRGVSVDCRPLRAVGYREALEVVTGQASPRGLVERIVKSTVHYARRQRTWFRREPNVTYVEVASVDEARERLLALSRAPVSGTTTAHA